MATDTPKERTSELRKMQPNQGEWNRKESEDSTQEGGAAAENKVERPRKLKEEMIAAPPEWGRRRLDYRKKTVSEHSHQRERKYEISSDTLKISRKINLIGYIKNLIGNIYEKSIYLIFRITYWPIIV